MEQRRQEDDPKRAGRAGCITVPFPRSWVGDVLGSEGRRHRPPPSLSTPRGASPGAAAGAGLRRPVPAAGRPAGPRPGAAAPRPAAPRAVAAPESPAPGPAAAARGPAGPHARRGGSGPEDPSHCRRHSRAPAPRPPWRPKRGLEPASLVVAARKCVTGERAESTSAPQAKTSPRLGSGSRT